MIEQPCQHGRVLSESEMEIHCWFHCVEPIPEDVFIVCLECGHAFTAEALLAGHNEHLAEFGGKPETDPDKVFACPECIHDF